MNEYIYILWQIKDNTEPTLLRACLSEAEALKAFSFHIRFSITERNGSAYYISREQIIEENEK